MDDLDDDALAMLDIDALTAAQPAPIRAPLAPRVEPTTGAQSKKRAVVAAAAEPAAATKQPKPCADEHPFGFPFPPYGVQEQLMRSLYRCLDDGGVGVFESPTGTGKSLSLLCATVRWLLEQERKEEEAASGGGGGGGDGDDDDDEPSWVTEQSRSSERAKVRDRAAALRKLVDDRERRLAAAAAERGRAELAANGFVLSGGRSADGGRGGGGGGRGRGRGAGGRGRGGGGDADEAAAKAKAAAKAAAAAVDGDSFVLDDPTGVGGAGSSVAGSTAALLAAAEKCDGDGDDEEEEAPRRRQILYASRTHSQLAQVVGEIRKTGYRKEVSVVTLGTPPAPQPCEPPAPPPCHQPPAPQPCSRALV